jgi:hypothetical protein
MWYIFLPSSSLLTSLVRSSNCTDLKIGCSTQYLNKSALICTNSTNSIMQFSGIELWKRCHHGNNEVFKTTTQFTLQIRYQVLITTGRTMNINERINDTTKVFYNVTIRQCNQENCKVPSRYKENKNCHK